MQTDFFSKLVSKARLNAEFMAHSLAVYANSQGRTESEVMQWLGSSESDLTRLALSRKPVDGTSSFRSDVQTIANFARVDPLKLAQLIRVADSVAAFRQEAGGAMDQTFRMAARDDGKRQKGEGNGPTL